MFHLFIIISCDPHKEIGCRCKRTRIAKYIGSGVLWFTANVGSKKINITIGLFMSTLCENTDLVSRCELLQDSCFRFNRCDYEMCWPNAENLSSLTSTDILCYCPSWDQSRTFWGVWLISSSGYRLINSQTSSLLTGSIRPVHYRWDRKRAGGGRQGSIQSF